MTELREVLLFDPLDFDYIVLSARATLMRMSAYR